MAGQRSAVRRMVQWRFGGRSLLAALLLASALLVGPASGTQAHTCTPDPQIGVSGRLLLPRASGLAVLDLADRSVQARPILPAQGVTSGVAISRDGDLLAAPRFWRPPDHLVGGQDILLVRLETGETIGALRREQPGEALGSPAWHPDGSLVYDRKVLRGSNEAVRIERAVPGQAPLVLAEDAYAPSLSPDGSLMALVRFDGTERLSVMPTAGGPELLLVAHPQILSIAFPRFSPDGSWIAFTAAADPAMGVGADGSRGAWRATVDAVSAAGAWKAPLGELASAWFGARPARAHGVPWDVWVVRPDGSELHQVTQFFDDDSSVAWSPDGQHLATLSAEAIHVVSFDGSRSYCVSNEGGYGAIEWLP